MPVTATAPLTPAALDVLTATRIDGTTVFITSGQLPRAVYVEVNKTLERIGGKWSRSAKGHVFTADPTARLAEILETGRMPVDSDKLLSFWPTPQESRWPGSSTSTSRWTCSPPGGRLAAIVPNSIAHSIRRPVVDLRDRITGMDGTWEMHPEGAFKESGTGVRTAVINAIQGGGH